MFGNKYLLFDTLPSTNDYAKNRIGELEHGTVIRAVHQTAGRGQPGKVWVSPDGENIYASIVLKPGDSFRITGSNINKIVLFSAKAVSKLLQDLYGLHSRIKPPNDIYVRDKKVSGILAESITHGDRIKGVIVGIGLNCNCPALPEDLMSRATSLEIEYGKKINVDVCFNKLVQYCEIFYNEMVAEAAAISS